MVRFGDYLDSNQVAGWEDYYISYKALKKTIKTYEGKAVNASGEELIAMQKLFSELLDSQVEKTVLVFLQRQGELVARLQRLQEERTERLGATVPPAAHDSFELAQSQAWVPAMMGEYRKVAHDLQTLLQFVSDNATGIRKILKKYDRRVGGHLGARYLESRTQHPYSQIQQVFRQVGVGALVATIMRNLGELHRLSEESDEATRRYSLYDMFAKRPEGPTYLAREEPAIQAIQDTMQRLTNAVNFGSYLANDLLLPKPLAGRPGETIVEEDIEFRWWPLQLNQINTFLYMVNYYIIVPTSDEYAELLHAPGSLCGVIIGAMPFCAIISALVYSKWSNHSYTQPLFFSTIVLIAGNVLYAAAFDSQAVWMLLMGRALAGLGCARAINRRYISDHVPMKMRTAASAAFVSASALGMAAGPATAGLLNLLDVKVGGMSVNAVTAPGWLMAALWLAYLLALLLLFKEPPQRRGGQRSTSSARPHDAAVPLLADDVEKDIAEGVGADSEVLATTDPGFDDEDEVKPVETLGALYREMSVPVGVLLFVYFMIKLAQEVLVSGSSLVTKYYFEWNINEVGLFLAVLGATVLPVSSLVGNYISNMYEDRLVLFWTQVLTALGVAAVLTLQPLIAYTPIQYVTAAIIIYVAANVTEGVNMALLSRVMSPALARGTFNCGLLSTEAGTFARVVGDCLISLSGGLLGTGAVLNATMLPVLFTAAASVALSWWRYASLF